jgi:CubicO group peptidase (beta-lactamase class C family)
MDRATNQLPVTKGYAYSNTNYVLAAMIAEKASGKSFTDFVHEMVIEPYGLTSAFYEASTYPEPVINGAISPLPRSSKAILSLLNETLALRWDPKSALAIASMVRLPMAPGMLLVIGSIPAFLGLIIVIPVLGHATWHLSAR